MCKYTPSTPQPPSIEQSKQFTLFVIFLTYTQAETNSDDTTIHHHHNKNVTHFRQTQENILLHTEMNHRPYLKSFC